MPRRSKEELNTRTLYQNSGGSVLLTLPIELIRELKWRDGQKVMVKKRGQTLSIEDWKRK